MKPRGQKNRFAVVPWLNPEQMNKVYRYLYSDSLTNKQWAVDQISIWSTRCHPSLPTAVESTVNIVRATIHDMLHQTDKTLFKEEDIRMLYCMALIRFVNLTLEHHQTGAGKIRMSVIAAKLNIPTWIVDLRNEAVHSFCPSLSMLRMGVDIALEYLERTFWSQEVAKAKPIINYPSEREAEILNLINQFKTLQFQRLEPALKIALSKDVKLVLKKMGAVMLREREKFIDVLVQPGNFLSAEELKRLIPKYAPFTLQEIHMILPPTVQKFWTPLFLKIHFQGLMPMFLEKLLLAQEKCNNKLCQKTAVAWALQILTGFSKTSSLSDCLRRKGLLLNIPCLLYACLKGVTPFSAELLSVIVGQYKNKKKLDFLFDYLALYQGRFVPKEDSKRKRDIEQEIIFSVEDAEEDRNEVRAKKMRSQKEENIWFSPSVTVDFSSVPIGGFMTPGNPDISQDKQPPEDSWRKLIKIEPSADDDFIIVNKNDGEGTVEEITHDINTFPVTTRPENFDMVYRRRPKQ